MIFLVGECQFPVHPQLPAIRSSESNLNRTRTIRFKLLKGVSHCSLVRCDQLVQIHNPVPLVRLFPDPRRLSDSSRVLLLQIDLRLRRVDRVESDSLPMVKRCYQPPAAEQSQLTLQVRFLSQLGQLIKHQIQLVRIERGTKRPQVDFLTLRGLLRFASLASRG